MDTLLRAQVGGWPGWVGGCWRGQCPHACGVLPAAWLLRRCQRVLRGRTGANCGSTRSHTVSACLPAHLAPLQDTALDQQRQRPGSGSDGRGCSGCCCVM